ncbi:MAG: DUF2256 domain-containing protein [Betaproteobacteria bacterium]|nr:DUF2256 domain-containing protein [Betaproteobacteria bacterium]
MPRKSPAKDSGFKGNKSYLPSKPCQSCGRPMTWRKRWAENWDAVRYCSQACRSAGAARP